MASIKNQIMSGVFYTAISKYLGIFISLLITAVLARLLTPADFGVIAISTVILAFFDLICNMGFGPAIIQHKRLSESELSDIFSFSILIGVLLGIVFFLLSRSIADYYHNEILINICRILAVDLLFISLNIVPNALMLKYKQFKQLAVFNLLIQIMLGVIAVLATYFGLGVYSLLIVPLGTNLFMFIINSIKLPVKLFFRFKIDFRSVQQILSFSIYQFLFNVVNYFSRNIDKLLIGKFIGMSGLGFYEKSYRLMMMPLSNVTNVITPTIQPIFSDFQNDKDRLLLYNMKIVRLLAFVGSVMTSFLFFSSKELILIVFGSQWQDAIPVFKILSLSVFVQMVDSVSGSTLQSSNSVKYLFISGFFCALINVGFILLGVFFLKSLKMIAVVVDIAFLLNLLVSFFYIYNKTFKVSMWNALKLFQIPIVTAFLISLVLYFLSLLVLPIIISFFLKLVISILIAIAVIQITGQYDMRLFLYNMINNLKR
jgi:O-antigen/teichoic acid export membrane protein